MPFKKFTLKIYKLQVNKTNNFYYKKHKINS